MDTPACIKCGKTMEAGFVLDKSYGEGYASPLEWADGVPQASFWTGIKLKNKEERRRVTTYRCSACGYLESYAP